VLREWRAAAMAPKLIMIPVIARQPTFQDGLRQLLDMPIERPSKFDLVVNRKTAKTLGIETPSALLTAPTR
jgi:hypothetical protein